MNQNRVNQFFITGTDTEIGKTTIATAIASKLVAAGAKVGAFKPVASGAELEGSQLVNDDARALEAVANANQTYKQINPHVFQPAIAPHLAAQAVGVAITVNSLVNHFYAMQAMADGWVIEGAGGWMVPLNATETFADLAQSLRAPVILVVGIRLGCISHALLTVQSILASNCRLVGWVANTVAENTAMYDEQIDTLKQRISAPMLGVVPYLPNSTPIEVADYISLPDE